jgi:regulator of nucleoside diphosphate kinase
MEENCMNTKAMPLGRHNTKPALIIDANLYPRLLALAEQARTHAPEIADQLLDEIERADLRAEEEMPADVVTIGSEVTFRDGERTQTVRIVLPRDADVDHGRVSVLTPVGAALLGLSAGQQITWEMADGRVKVIEVVDVRQ